MPYSLAEAAQATGLNAAKPDGGELAPPQSAQPNLEEWITRYGGRARIPWAEWDHAIEEWKAARRAEFKRKKLLGRMQSAALPTG